jgi:hypothetical protein
MNTTLHEPTEEEWQAYLDRLEAGEKHYPPAFPHKKGGYKVLSTPTFHEENDAA